MKDPKTMTRQEALDYIAKIKEGRDAEAVEFAKRAMKPWPGDKEAACQWRELNNRAFAPLSDGERATEAKTNECQFTRDQIMESRTLISQMKSDSQFQRAYWNPSELGHAQAVDSWNAAHESAFPAGAEKVLAQ
jgi:hypothetical protein